MPDFEQSKEQQNNDAHQYQPSEKQSDPSKKNSGSSNLRGRWKRANRPSQGGSNPEVVASAAIKGGVVVRRSSEKKEFRELIEDADEGDVELDIDNDEDRKEVAEGDDSEADEQKQRPERGHRGRSYQRESSGRSYEPRSHSHSHTHAHSHTTRHAKEGFLGRILNAIKSFFGFGKKHNHSDSRERRNYDGNGRDGYRNRSGGRPRGGSYRRDGGGGRRDNNRGRSRNQSR